MALMGNALGGYGDFVRKGGQLGASIKNVGPEPKKPVKGGVDETITLYKGKGAGLDLNPNYNVKGEKPSIKSTSYADNFETASRYGDVSEVKVKSSDIMPSEEYTQLVRSIDKNNVSPAIWRDEKFGPIIEKEVKARGYKGFRASLDDAGKSREIVMFSQPTKKPVKGGVDIDVKPPKELAPRKGGSVGVKVAGDTTPKFLKEGIKYEEPARVLTPDEINRISGRSMLADENKQVKNLFGEWLGKRKSADIEATKIASKYTDIKASEGFDVVRALQGKADVPATAKGQVTRLRKAFDAARISIMDLDKRIDIGYIDDYVTQIWKESPQQIINKAEKMGLSQRLKFANERVIADYDTGIKLGLSPKFKNPAEILKEYLSQGYKLKANLDMADNLYKQGLAVPAQVAKNSPGFEFIKVSGLPNGGIFVPKKTASYFRNAFGSNEAVGKLGKTLEVGAKISRTGQELTLSGGVPGTPINFFGIGAVLQKEVLSGKPVVGFKNMAKASFGDKYAIKYF
jgi:hypothetical protein